MVLINSIIPRWSKPKAGSVGAWEKCRILGPVQTTVPKSAFDSKGAPSCGHGDILKSETAGPMALEAIWNRDAL
jgi:hypothetical protein